MLRKLLLAGMLCAFPCLYAFAQSGSISGTITNAETGEPVISANVFVQQAQRGAATDADGKFTIENLEPGTYTLRVTFVGYNRFEEQVEVDSEGTTVNIQMQEATIGLDDVVVTAQGIQREKRALGYAVSTIESKALENQGQSDVSRILKGKVPGVNITQTSGVSGTATDFTVRGYTTISGSNKPLFIVDGVQFSTSTNSQSGFTDGGSLSTSSRFLDLDPNNIQSVNVLKGLSATTIYGEEGRNGVVIIETKSGSFDEDREPGFEVSIGQSFFTNSIASLPDYQDRYGGGFHQNYGFFFSNWGPDMTRNLENELAAFDPSDNSGLFIRFDEQMGRNIIAHPFSQISDPDIRAAFPQFQPGGDQFEYALRPYDNVGPFFNTGLVSNTNLNISGGTQEANLNLSIGLSDEEGFTPGNNLIKNNVGLGANFEVFEGLTVNTTANLALTDMETPPIGSSFGSSASVSGGGSIFGDVFYTPRSVDLNGLPFQNPVDNSSVYYRGGNDIENPRWILENIKRTDNVDRLFGKTEVNYQVIPELTVTYKLGLDTYSENQSYRLNQGGVNNPDLLQGYYHTRNIQETIYDHNMIFNYRTDFTQELSFEAVAGAQFLLEKYEQDGIGSQNQIIYDLFEHGNFTSPSATNALNGA
jgi:TonB-dependent SusC/RagA subfamily outer membrane receptor